jgi:hypothetical protein
VTDGKLTGDPNVLVVSFCVGPPLTVIEPVVKTLSMTDELPWILGQSEPEPIAPMLPLVPAPEPGYAPVAELQLSMVELPPKSSGQDFDATPNWKPGMHDAP